LWLEDALGSIRAQTCFDKHEWIVVVGLDAETKLPTTTKPTGLSVSYAWSLSRTQACAVNAAASEVVWQGAEVVALLEDDDLWCPSKMEVQIESLKRVPFSSCSQRVLSEDRRSVLGTNDYPIPSGWVMWTHVWKRIGGFDLNFRYLVDTEWLGRLNQVRVPRLHFVEKRNHVEEWHFLFESFVHRHAVVVSTGLFTPLVDRTQNSLGGMATINRDSEASALADKEQGLLITRFGENPW
jgi:hypothetical protein